MSTSRLFLELRIEFPADMSQDHLSEVAEQLKDMMYDELSAENAEVPCIDVTYEKVMILTK